MASAMEEDEVCKRSDDHSSLIASKLLQGWALLNEHCPRCYTPLVRNKEKKMYCVACDHWVGKESDMNPSQEAEKQGGGEDSNGVHGRTRDGIVDDVKRSPKRLSCDGAFTGSQTPTVLLPKVDEYGQAIPHAINTLYQKIEELQLCISMTRDVSQLKQLVDALSACLQCIELASKVQTLSL